uniref:Uncharacterized protein n=1 Tax=Arundo donax TaxID=35708 RepID=A0A0A9HMM6_ARUDO
MRMLFVSGWRLAIRYFCAFRNAENVYGVLKHLYIGSVRLCWRSRSLCRVQRQHSAIIEDTTDH